MKSVEQIQMLIVLIVADVADHGGEHPSGHVYARLMDQCTKRDYDTVLKFGEEQGLWAVASSHLVSLTPMGQTLADNIRRRVLQG